MSDKELHEPQEVETLTEETNAPVHDAPPEEAPQQVQDKFKETTEKLWGSTKTAWCTTTFKASQYKRLVQKKIDLTALHKKIDAAHADLGKLIDDMREAGRKSIMTQKEVKDILTRLDNLKEDAAALEEEIENIKEEGPAAAPPADDQA